MIDDINNKPNITYHGLKCTICHIPNDQLKYLNIPEKIREANYNKDICRECMEELLQTYFKLNFPKGILCH